MRQILIPTHDIIIIILVRSAASNTANTAKPLPREFLHYYLMHASPRGLEGEAYEHSRWYRNDKVDISRHGHLLRRCFLWWGEAAKAGQQIQWQLPALHEPPPYGEPSAPRPRLTLHDNDETIPMVRGVRDQVRNRYFRTVESVVGSGSFSGGWRTDLVNVILPFGRRDHVSSYS